MRPYFQGRFGSVIRAVSLFGIASCADVAAANDDAWVAGDTTALEAFLRDHEFEPLGRDGDGDRAWLSWFLASDRRALAERRLPAGALADDVAAELCERVPERLTFVNADLRGTRVGGRFEGGSLLGGTWAVADARLYRLPPADDSRSPRMLLTLGARPLDRPLGVHGGSAAVQGYWATTGWGLAFRTSDCEAELGHLIFLQRADTDPGVGQVMIAIDGMPGWITFGELGHFGRRMRMLSLSGQVGRHSPDPIVVRATPRR